MKSYKPLRLSIRFTVAIPLSALVHTSSVNQALVVVWLLGCDGVNDQPRQRLRLLTNRY